MSESLRFATACSDDRWKGTQRLRQLKGTAVPSFYVPLENDSNETEQKRGSRQANQSTRSSLVRVRRAHQGRGHEFAAVRLGHSTMFPSDSHSPQKRGMNFSEWPQAGNANTTREEMSGGGKPNMQEFSDYLAFPQVLRKLD